MVIAGWLVVDVQLAALETPGYSKEAQLIGKCTARGAALEVPVFALDVLTDGH